MSRIIKKIIKFMLNHMEIGILLGAAILIAFILSKNAPAIVIMILLEAIMIPLKLNTVLKRRIYNLVNLFTANSDVRNIDCLVIGDMSCVCDVYAQCAQVIEVCAPNRTLCASYEILRHTYSILKEHGKVIIACKEKNTEKKAYSVFDVFFFHLVTVRRLRLESLKKKCKFPLLSNPVSSIQLLLNSRKKYEIAECKNNEISDFCKARGLDFEYRCYK